MNKKIIHSSFDHIAGLFPANTAIQQPGRTITYAELYTASNRIADLLMRQQITGGKVIAVYLESSIEYITAILGINKAGNIFMPMDTGYPAGRLMYIVNEVQPEVFITDEKHKEKLEALLSDPAISPLACTKIILTGTSGTVSIEKGTGGQSETVLLSGFNSNPQLPELTGDESNYLLYTSGSTGNPKAIEGCHKGLAHFIHWEVKEFSLGTETKVAQLAPLLFDVSLRDIFAPLLAGGTLCIPPAELKVSMEKFIRWIGDNSITLLHIVPSVFRLLMKELEENNSLLSQVVSLKYILFAGEPLYGRDVNRWREIAGTGVQLVNMYGPSETTLAKLFNRIGEETAEPHDIIPLGKPLPNTAVIIARDNMLCGIGEIGDIYIKTPFRSKGYYKNPELTQSCFVQNPVNPDVEDIVYRTGDLGKYLKDRSVAYVGRKDTQVKIRGNRVETIEVEKTIMQHLQAAQVLVVPVLNADGESVLACYCLEQDNPDIEAVRHHLTATLPEYMHPSYFVMLKEFTLSINGKIDRKALPRPEALLYNRLSYEAPVTDLHKKLEVMWAAELRLSKIGINNSFFELGGHSLSATRIVSGIYREMGKEISLKDFFDHSTIAGLASLLEARTTAGYTPIPRVEQQEYYDVSHAQKRMWILNQIEEERIAYNLPGGYIFSGSLNRTAFDNAFSRLIARHESLRTTFQMIGGELKQIIHLPAATGFECHYTDLRDTEDSSRIIAAIAGEEATAVFDLVNGPLLNARLIHVDDKTFVFLFTLHHIVSDGWSRNVLISEITTLYNTFCRGEEDTLPALPVQYKDYAAWQNDQLGKEIAGVHQAYWLSQFKDELTVLNLPADFERPKIKKYDGDITGMALDKELAKKIIKLAREKDVSLFILLLASLKTLLYRYTRQCDIVVGTPVAGRNHPDLENQIGFFVNTLALRTVFPSSIRFHEFLNLVKENTLNGFEHQVYPFDRLVDELGIARDMSRSPLFDVMMVLQNLGDGNEETSALEGLSVGDFRQKISVSKFDLTFNFYTTAEDITVSVEYAVDIFKPETIERLISNFNVLLTAIVQNPAAALNELELVTAGEKAVMTDLFNDTAMAYQKHSTLVTMFEQQVRERPEAIALVYGNETLTYQQLNERSNRLANFLITEKRLQKSNPVAVSMGRSPGLIIAILAVLKTGCYYVPVDPDYPADRRDFMIKDGGIELVLVNNESQDLYIDPVASYNVDTIPGEFNAANPEVEILSSDLCYIIYTSGSTGLPKGVMVEHGNVVNLLHGCNRHFAFTSEDVWSLFHSVSFDFSVWEIFGSLTTGGRLVLVSLDEARDAEAFASLLSEKKVTVLNQVPTMFGQLAEEIAGNPVPLSLRYVIFGGEALNPGMLKNWHNSYSEVKLVNMYGITETTVHVTFKEITAAEIEGGQSNIGTPLGNVKLYIMDSDHQLMPIGAVGEIVVGGAGVSRGYLNRQELNNERFINNPFSPGEFLYCSGDLGLQLSGGEVVYKGRGDDQVKIRGYRIELGEIERSLLQHAAINAAVVVKHTAAQGSAQLVAYIVGDKQLTVQEMRSYLAESLPDYMLPSHFIQINSLPVTANGKVNRALLPEPQFQAMDNGTVYEEPVTEHEQELAAIWKEVLGRDRISIADNFFEIGGDSIKAIQIASKIFRTGYKITVREIFQFPTIKELALCFKKVERIPEQSLITGEFPLTPVQADFFAASVINPHHYNQAVMLFYEQRFDRDILQRTIAQIQEHHDQLRVTFRKNSNGAIVQSVSGTDHPVSIAYFDLRNATDPYGEMNSLSNSIQSGIDLENGPLMKLGLFSLSDGDRLLIVIHHLAIDGVSWRIIFEDLESIYRQALEGRETPLPLKTDSYKLWAEKINVYADSKSLLEEKKYWKNLDLVNVVPLRPDRETAMNNLADTGGMSFTLTAEETELLLTKVHVPYNTQINDILLVALGLSVKNHFGLPQTLIALEGHGRESILGDIDISRTIGWFTSIYPVLITPVQDNNLSLAIREVKEMLNKIPARGVGYGILKYLTAEANKQDISLTVNPPISFNYLGQFDTDVKNTFFQVSGEPKGNIRDISGERRYEFDISGMIAGGILKITIEYNKTRFSETTISGFMDAYKEALSRVISFCCTVSEKESSPSDFGFKELSINELETFFD